MQRCFHYQSIRKLTSTTSGYATPNLLCELHLTFCRAALMPSPPFQPQAPHTKTTAWGWSRTTQHEAGRSSTGCSSLLSAQSFLHISRSNQLHPKPQS
eukprot:jgi/Botrbrau1/20295/Bobra.31_1s0073.1